MGPAQHAKGAKIEPNLGHNGICLITRTDTVKIVSTLAMITLPDSWIETP